VSTAFVRFCFAFGILGGGGGKGFGAGDYIFGETRKIAICLGFLATRSGV
jgi:hypothetical protein